MSVSSLSTFPLSESVEYAFSFRIVFFSDVEVKQPDRRRLIEAVGERIRGERLVREDRGVGEPAIDESSELSSVPRKLPYRAELSVKGGRSAVNIGGCWVVLTSGAALD